MHTDQANPRILFISHDGSLTGAPIFLKNLLEYILFSGLKYNISIHFANDGRLIQDLQSKGFNVTFFKKSSSESAFLLKVLNRLRYYLNFVLLLIKFKPNIIYSNTIVNFSQVILGRLMGAKLLVHMHEGNDFVSKERLRLKFSSFFTTKYIVGSKYVGRILNKYTGSDGTVIYNGIQVSEPRPLVISQSQSKYSLFVIGTIDRNKSQLIAIKALDYLVKTKNLDVCLTIVGKVNDNEYYEEIVAYVNKNNLQSVITFTGLIEKIEEAYTDMDVLIVPSLDEAFPTVILESMAACKPVIASNTGGIPEIVIDHMTGLLFEKGNHIDLAEKIALFASDELRRLMTNNAYLHVKANFSIEDTNKKVISIIDNVFDMSTAMVSKRNKL